MKFGGSLLVKAVVNKEELENIWKQRVQKMVADGRNVTKPIITELIVPEFQELNKGKEGFDNFVNNIVEVIKEEVEEDVNQYTLKFSSGSKIEFDTTGNIQKYKVNGSKSPTTSRSGGHVILKERDYANSDLSLERLVYLAECMLMNKLPDTFDGLNVNCMDLCGNTQNSLGVSYNMCIDNLELVSADENLRHSRLAHKIHKLTGKVYRFTARDFFLSYIVDSKPQFIEWYMDLCGYPQVK